MFASLITHALSAEAGSGSSWMLIMPAGEIRARDGRGPFRMPAEAMQAVIDRSLAYADGIEIMVDYDHQFAAVKRGEGATAKAAGWVKEIEARADGIYARVEWTDAAREAIKGREYRYLSPYFTVDGKNAVHTILNVALVNHPALSLEAVAAMAREGTPAMDFMGKLRKALSLGDDASEDAILSAIGKMGGGKDDEAMAAAIAKAVDGALSPVALAAGAAGVKDPEKLAAAVKALAEAGGDDQGKVIVALQAEVNELATKLAERDEASAREKAVAFVDGAIAEGKVGVKPLRDHYINRHMKDAAGVEKEIAAFATLGGNGAILPVAPPAEGGAVALSATQKEAAAALGMSIKDYAAHLKAESEGAEA